MQDYFMERTQRLKVGRLYSDPAFIQHGVPQGGSLSSILFAIYINDLLKTENTAMKCLGYADDTTLLFSFNDRINWSLIDHELRKIMRWSQANGLLLNASKSNYIVFGFVRSIPRHPIKLHRTECAVYPEVVPYNNCSCGTIENVSSTKYLGVMIDEQISWKTHIANLVKKLRASAATIAKLSYTVDRRTTILVYKAIFETYLRYGILAYCAAFKNTISAIETIQNNLVRRIMNAEPRCSTENMYRELDILPITRIYAKCLLMECIVRNPVPAQSIIENLRPTHDYDTRSDIIRPTRVRLVRYDRIYLNRYVKIYRDNPQVVNAVLAAETVSQKKRLICDFAGSVPLQTIE